MPATCLFSLYNCAPWILDSVGTKRIPSFFLLRTPPRWKMSGYGPGEQYYNAKFRLKLFFFCSFVFNGFIISKIVLLIANFLHVIRFHLKLFFTFPHLLLYKIFILRKFFLAVADLSHRACLSAQKFKLHFPGIKPLPNLNLYMNQFWNYTVYFNFQEM